MKCRWFQGLYTFRAEDADANYRFNRVLPTIYASFRSSECSNRVATLLRIQSVIAGKRNWQTRIFAVIGHGSNSRPFRSLCPLSLSALYYLNVIYTGGGERKRFHGTVTNYEFRAIQVSSGQFSLLFQLYTFIFFPFFFFSFSLRDRKFTNKSIQLHE